MVTLTKKRSINNQIEKSVNSKRMDKTKKEIQKRYARVDPRDSNGVVRCAGSLIVYRLTYRISLCRLC